MGVGWGEEVIKTKRCTTYGKNRKVGEGISRLSISGVDGTDESAELLLRW